MPTNDDGLTATSDVDSASIAENGTRIDRGLLLFACLVVLAAMVFVVQRSRLGCDVLDEAYYAAMSYRFFLGDRPFADEISPHQTSALPTVPIVASHVQVYGSTDGLLLSLRRTYLVFALVTALVIAFFVLRRLLSWPAALLAALACILFAPGNVFTFSYNTQGMLLLAVALFLSFEASLPPSDGDQSSPRWQAD